ncbi:MAG: hypothetical protein JG782_218 [Anaerophaga sp.]|uniref:Rieske 2Fe-2S domain-containing protein n=1 Tax=Anaerophaga thermohalophila TaxID=177400 RepID=UPI000237C26E|nr:Rieske 2Fe-2S domain-containing protein [Anaerophaga thermohalophila]MBZ4675599.1 hypothetical protein [Anaerophaga sp.]MDK2841409.1 hypothetical protein [Anaerophaga sp.]MDN5290156.1 hypothetical protein [Anaerophaga sp.]
MQKFFTFFVFAMLLLMNSGCGEKDDFPQRQFTGYFDLTNPRYSKTVFTARRDMDGSYVGINGIVVYNMGGTYYAFDLMCPYEKKPTCSVNVDVEEDTEFAVCECCHSKFLIASPQGDVVDGPAGRGLQRYNTSVTTDGYLVVTSSY